jgi:hypothetical protein
MRKQSKPKKPTEYQARVLKMIASSPLVKTYSPDRPEPRWSLTNGTGVTDPCAKALIRNGWVKPVRDGLSMFDESQTYTVLQAPRDN